MWRQTQRIVCLPSLQRFGILKEKQFRFSFISQFNKFPVRTIADDSNLTKLFQPAPVKVNTELQNIGAELSGTLSKADILKILNKLTQKKEIIALCKEYGLDDYIQQQAFASFRKYCFQIENLPPELYIRFYDIEHGAGHVDDIFPHFLQHAKEIFPHLNCMNDLRKISDLTNPANWYPDARVQGRKVYFHAGPTNSGKTYQAMQRFLQAKSGIYCGPLKLLASEVFIKSNKEGTPCDLVTGEERRYGKSEESPANHIACTVEMTALNKPFEVAIIDEIQLLRDPTRGWAWTRAFLGVNAEEVHVCGEAGTIPLLEKLCDSTLDILETNIYKRLTELTVEDRALESLTNVQPGDCIVCFNKNDVYSVSQGIEAMGKEVAVIYGSLPPNTKLAQAAKFNDPSNSCKIMVATDAIGMGLNLSIRRIIFYSVVKPTKNEKGQQEILTISVSSALQIAGRAGRFGTQWEHGFVTTYNRADLPTLQYLLSQQAEPVVQAGLHPTADQIELFSYHLPSATFSNLLDIFVEMCTVDDSLYFVCQIESMKYLADMIQHVPLSLRARYVFCCAPINLKMPFVCAMFLKMANQYSKYEPITAEWLAKECGCPLSPPKTIADLMQLESVFDVMDIYLWLSYRFNDMFPHAIQVREAQKQLDELIQIGLQHIAKLLKNTNLSNSEIPIPSIVETDEGRVKTTKTLKPQINSGSLAQQLVSSGVLTPKMLGKLQQEWTQLQSQPESKRSSQKKNSKKHKRNKK